MIPARKSSRPTPVPPVSAADRQIRDFLEGKTQGEDILHALYDHVLDEPVPERLSALLRS
jgi:anti-sigma factor NepR-like protein